MHMCVPIIYYTYNTFNLLYEAVPRPTGVWLVLALI